MSRVSLVGLLSLAAALAQSPPQTAGATIQGTVTVGEGRTIHNADVIVLRTSFRAETDETGKYKLAGLPPGSYDIVAHAHGLSDARSRLEFKAGSSVTVDFVLNLSPVL